MAMFVAAVNGHLWYSCVTTAIRARSPSTFQSDSGRPFHSMLPSVGARRPAIIAARVVLPEPFSPTNATVCPAVIVNVTSSTAGVSRSG